MRILIAISLLGLGAVLAPLSQPVSCCDEGPSVAACNGSSNCKVCTNCSRCKHCKDGGTCGKCSK